MGIAERAMSGRGKRIDVSMLQAAASWLITVLPLVDFGCEDWEISRAGNEHRKFVPTNAYPTSDGAVLIAIGSDALWRRLTEIPKFAGVDNEARRVNSGRLAERAQIHADIMDVTRNHSTEEIAADMRAARIPHAPILTVPQVMALEAISGKLTATRDTAGKPIRMQPMAVDEEDGRSELDFPPRYGEHTDAVLREVGYGEGDLAALHESGVIAGPEALDGANAG